MSIVGMIVDALSEAAEALGKSAPFHRRRAGFWKRRGDALKAKSIEVRSTKRHFALLRRAAMCYARAKFHADEADKIEEGKP